MKRKVTLILLGIICCICMCSCSKEKDISMNASIAELINELQIDKCIVKSVNTAKLYEIIEEESCLKYSEISKTVLETAEEEVTIKDKKESEISIGDVVYAKVKVKNKYGITIVKDENVAFMVGTGSFCKSAEEQMIGKTVPFSVKLSADEFGNTFYSKEGAQQIVISVYNNTEWSIKNEETYVSEAVDDIVEHYCRLFTLRLMEFNYMYYYEKIPESIEKIEKCIEYSLDETQVKEYAEYLRNSYMEIAELNKTSLDDYMSSIGENDSKETTFVRLAESEIKRILLCGLMAGEYGVEWNEDLYQKELQSYSNGTLTEYDKNIGKLVAMEKLTYATCGIYKEVVIEGFDSAAWKENGWQ